VLCFGESRISVKKDCQLGAWDGIWQIIGHSRQPAEMGNVAGQETGRYSGWPVAFVQSALVFLPSQTERYVKYDLITDAGQLSKFCEESEGEEILGFDTEFVSENLYRPQLCLIQAATSKRMVLIDTIAVRDVRPFWNLVCDGVGQVVAHAAREEFLFCYRDCKRRPARLFDLQIAAGFVGYDYPAAYSTLVGQIEGTSLNKGETRTDWRQRPLSQKQLQYAAQDVEHLATLHAHLFSALEKNGRLGWYEQEVNAWQEQLEDSETQPAWLRMSGLSRLNRRSLGLVRQLSEWRDSVAAGENRSPRRILPDDLLIEIAKRGEADLSRLKAIRGLQNRVSARFLNDITEQVALAMAIDDEDLPSKIRVAPSVNLGILGQFLQTGLNLICVRERIAPGLVANAQDVRDLAARMMGMLETSEPLKLDSGWRREIVGKSFANLLNGKLALRIANLDQDQPLELVAWNGDGAS